MAKLRKRTIAALDIGNSKIVCFIGTLDAQGTIAITGIGHQVAQGIKGSVVSNIEKAEYAIRQAVSAAEHMAGVKIDRVVINISHPQQRTRHTQVEMNTTGQEITQRDIISLAERAYAAHEQDDIQIIHALPVDYIVDGIKNIDHPKSMQANQFGLLMHVIETPLSPVYNIAQLLAKCHLDIENYISAPYAAALACLEEDEKELGTMLIDFGAHTTSIAILRDRKLLYVTVLPIGSAHITNDLAIGLSTSIESAERIKTLFGNVMPSPRDEQEFIDVPQTFETGVTENVSIEQARVIEIIRPRVEELLEKIGARLEESGLGSVTGTLVMTGGGSQLAGLKELVEQSFGKKTRLGRPRHLEGLAESIKGPSFATAVGLLDYQRHLQQQTIEDMDTESLRKKNIFLRLFYWVRESF